LHLHYFDKTCSDDRKTVVELLLTPGTKINAKKWIYDSLYPLCMEKMLLNLAFEYVNSETVYVVKALLQKGANIKEKNKKG